MKKVLIIDGNSILNRAFYAIRPLTTKNGLQTNAIYGLISSVMNQMGNLAPDYCAVAFDMRAPTFRHKLYDGYKANRKGMPEELAVQLPYAKKALSAMGIKVLEKEGYEADDILGTIAKMAEASDSITDVFVYTGDRDAFQLISKKIKVLLATNSDAILFDENEFIERYNVTPTQYIDVKALMGDSSDNIPGVAGIGEKTAFKLISEEGSLDNVYARLNERTMTPSMKMKLMDGKESAYLSKELATIKLDVPLDISLEDIRKEEPNREELIELFSELEFNAFIKKLSLTEKKEQSSFEKIKEEQVCSLRGDLYSIILYLPEQKKTDEVVVPSKAEPILKIRLSDGDKCYECEFTNILYIKKFFDDNRKLIAFDTKQAYKTLMKFGIDNFEFTDDIMLLAYLINPSDTEYTPAKLALNYLGYVNDDADNDPKLIFSLLNPLKERMKNDNLSDVYHKIELPLAKTLARTENFGFKIDRAGIIGFSLRLDEMINRSAERIYNLAGTAFNINSPKQLGEVLFEKLQLPTLKKNKSGYSTNADVLEKLRPYHPIINEILEYRQVTKLKSTYAEGLLKAASIEDDRVRTVFRQTVTTTGRLSSIEPNLQNIPIKSELGHEIRKYFIPENRNYIFIDADYSQIELRVLAHMSGDEVMIDAFNNNLDIHKITASQVFNVPIDEVTPEQRSRAKAVNFGIIYGMGSYTLAEELGITRYKATDYIASYFQKYPSVDKYLKQTVNKARELGYVTTLFGRRRYIPEINSPKATLRSFGERVAMNSPIQGTSADIIKIAMVNVDKRLRERGLDAHIVLQVHDELLIESKIDCASEVADILKYEMENAVKLSVPLKVDISVGSRWYDNK